MQTGVIHERGLKTWNISDLSNEPRDSTTSVFVFNKSGSFYFPSS
jgi:hypothetical protein